MERALGRDLRRSVSVVSERVFRISGAFQAKRQKLADRGGPGIAIGKALALFALASIAGWYAYREAASDSLARWIRSTGPTPAIWNHALGSRGYQPVTSDSLKATLGHSLPAAWDPTRSLWFAEDGAWVAVFLAEGEPSFWGRRLIAKRPDTNQVNWTALAPGWLGFDDVLARIDALPPLPETAVSPPKAQWRDPRAIVY